MTPARPDASSGGRDARLDPPPPVRPPRPRRIRRLHVLILVLALCLLAVPLRERIRRFARPVVEPLVHKLQGRATVADRVAQIGGAVRARLEPDFQRVGVPYPPEAVTLVGLKEEERLEVWVSADGRQFRHLRDYPILAASGATGPKLREGDMQVPEGFYGIESLNPNSAYHLALRVDYPNRHDREMARLDGRTDLGGDIMIHGNSVSIGCLAMGDAAAEDLFLLAAETGIRGIRVILAPLDLRARSAPDLPEGAPEWTGELYQQLAEEMRKLGPGR
jgi:hypothetical protein